MKEEKTELERKYEEALEIIAAGSSWETVVAKSILDRKHGRGRRFVAYLKENLAAIASVTIAISGIGFGILQYKTGEWRQQREMTIARVEALQKLLPSLTSQNPHERRYALSALFTLYSDDSSSVNNKDFQALLEQIGEVGDAETVEAIAGKRNDDVKLKKRAAELYAIRAEQHRRDAEAAEPPTDDEEQAYQNYLRAKQYLASAWWHAERSLSLDSENARATYQLGVVLEVRKQFTEASEKFSQAIKLFEAGKYPKDTEIYPRSYLGKMRCLYQQEKKVTAEVCDVYKIAKTRYQELRLGEIDLKAEKLEPVADHCP